MIDRRDFLKLAGIGPIAGLAREGRVASAAPVPLTAQKPATKRWPKAFMLGQSEGPIRPVFEDLVAAGFDGVELVSPNRLDRDEVLKARDATGIVIHGLSGSQHWAKPLSDPDPKVVEAGMAAIRSEIEEAAALGATTVLVVPAVVKPSVSHREAYERSQARIAELVPFAAENGIVLAIEEVWNKFLLSAPEFSRYIDELDSPNVRAYFDVGNVVEYGFPPEWIRELAGRIAKVHVKEYAKPDRFSYKLGEGGEIDWPEVRRAFLEVGYDGWITAEVGAEGREQLADVHRRLELLLPSD